MIASLIRYPGGRGSIELEPKNLHGLRQSLDGVRRTMARPESPTAARLVSRSPPRDRKWNGSVSSGAAPSGPPSGDEATPFSLELRHERFRQGAGRFRALLCDLRRKTDALIEWHVPRGP